MKKILDQLERTLRQRSGFIKRPLAILGVVLVGLLTGLMLLQADSPAVAPPGDSTVTVVSNSPDQAVIDWGHTNDIDGDAYIGPMPPWVLGAGKIGGEWTNFTWHVAAGEPANEGQAQIYLDRSLLTNDLQMSVLLFDFTNASLFVDLLDSNSVMVASNLFDNLLAGTTQMVSVTVEVPLTNYPTAALIQLRRGDGEVTVYRSELALNPPTQSSADTAQAGPQATEPANSLSLSTSGSVANPSAQSVNSTSSLLNSGVAQTTAASPAGRLHRMELGDSTVYYFADSIIGSDTFDGLAAAYASGHGPKRTIGAAITGACDNAVIEVAAGNYQELIWNSSVTWNPGANDLTLDYTGNVNVVDNFSTVGDGIPDWWKVAYGFSITNSIASLTNISASAHGLTNLKVYQNPSVLVANGYSILGDGIPDWWKVTYGFSVSDPTVASSDPDQDGYTALQDYNFGINPTNSASFPTNVPAYVVAWWRFDEGAGTNAFDASGNNNTGVLAGYPLPIWTNGISSNALAFATAYTNAVSVADALILSPTQAVTLVTWVQATNTVSGIILSKWANDDSAGSYSLALSNGYPVFDLSLGGVATQLVGATSLPDGYWHQVAATYDGTQMVTYLDAVTNASLAVTGRVDIAPVPLSIGQLTGILDDVRIYNNVLSTNDLNTIYSYSTLGDGIADWWKLKYGFSLTDPTVAGAVSTNPFAHGLTNLQIYQNPSVLIADNYSTLGDGLPDWWKIKGGFSITDPTLFSGPPTFIVTYPTNGATICP